jgi:hypothetical protein
MLITTIIPEAIIASNYLWESQCEGTKSVVATTSDACALSGGLTHLPSLGRSWYQLLLGCMTACRLKGGDEFLMNYEGANLPSSAWNTFVPLIMQSLGHARAPS